MLKIQDGPGTTKNLSNRNHEEVRRANKAKQRRGNTVGTKSIKGLPLFDAIQADKKESSQMREEDRRKEAARRRLVSDKTRLELVSKLSKLPVVLEIAEIMLDKYNSASPIRTDGKMKWWLQLSEERTRVHFKDAKPAILNLAIRAVKDELTYQLSMTPQEA
jgi:hypothetical protein